MDRIELTKGKFALVDAEDFEWLNQWKWHFVGKYSGAGRMEREGEKKKRILMHIAILGKYNKLKKELETDHINRNPLDNRKINLRVVTHQENAMNRGMFKNNTSGYKGVCWDGSTTNKLKKWQARINLNGKFKNLGRFLTKEEAAIVYNQAVRENFGEVNYFNQIGGQIG